MEVLLPTLLVQLLSRNFIKWLSPATAYTQLTTFSKAVLMRTPVTEKIDSWARLNPQKHA